MIHDHPLRDHLVIGAENHRDSHSVKGQERIITVDIDLFEADIRLPDRPFDYRSGVVA